ncbi:hemerythrin family protein [Azotosporobacter soli]|uniref:bacteriohemerythrin n=1 Tax=Azotosporobacter soli TaxID=3055040 RepID=UPI0031FF2FA7
MNAIPWREDYDTGFQRMDDEHRALLQIVNELFAKSGEGITRTLEFDNGLMELNRRLQAHFTQEEKWMKEHDALNAQEHCLDHHWILSGARWFTESYFKGNAQAPGEGLMVFEAYFEKHLSGYDKELADFLRARLAR